MTGKQILKEAKSLEKELIKNRRWLHAHAETGFALSETKKFVEERLKEMGYTPEPCGKSGVVVTIGRQKSKNGKAFLLRADMDGLPIKEETGLDFACTNGNMHACGHDLHTAALLGAAKLLKMHEDDLNGVIKLLFQPAEETLEGAADVLKAGVLRSPEVDGAMMLHVLTDLPLPSGTMIVSKEGVSAPAADYFSVEVWGKGCHGSMPQNGVDALMIAAHILVGTEELSARELSAFKPAILTFGALHAGKAGNVIADKAVMHGTLRAFDEEVRLKAKKRLKEITEGIASAFRGKANLRFKSGCPSLLNDGTLSAFVLACAQELMGNRAISSSSFAGGDQAGGSEDFAYISREVPSVMVALCAGEREKGYAYPLHHPKANFSESVLPLASALFAHVALKRFRG
ncbi:MAG: amidohydrolase [Clostridia bacterium]|nr:amidohydrolase [Clostridia bacterium]